MSFKANVLLFEGTRNTRDFGGIKTVDGKTIKPHRIIRSEYLHRITDNDIRKFHQYGLKTVIDLRGPGEVASFPDREIPGVKTYFYNMTVEDNLVHGQKYPHREYHVADKDLSSLLDFMFTRSATADADECQITTYRAINISPRCIQNWKDIFSLFLNQKEGSILFHCTDGKDRTGMTAILILSALGVDEETILADYLATNDFFVERKHNRDLYLHQETDLEEPIIQSILKVTGVAKEWYDALMSSMKERYGSVMGFLKGPIGLTDADIQSLRDNYLE